jgi:protein-tyrosine phosphatase
MSPDSQRPFRLLFVCLGNICRSPAAEIIFRKLATDAGVAHRFEIDSAGTLGYHCGSPPDRRMSAALGRLGYTVAGNARQILVADLERQDLIVTMDDDNLAEVRKLDRPGTFHGKIRPLVGFCREHTDRHVPDPYYGGQAGFDHVIRLLEDGCAGLLAWHSRQAQP